VWLSVTKYCAFGNVTNLQRRPAVERWYIWQDRVVIIYAALTMSIHWRKIHKITAAGFSTQSAHTWIIRPTKYGITGYHVRQRVTLFTHWMLDADRRRHVGVPCVSWHRHAPQLQPIRRFQYRSWPATWPRWWIVAMVIPMSTWFCSVRDGVKAFDEFERSSTVLTSVLCGICERKNEDKLCNVSCLFWFLQVLM